MESYAADKLVRFMEALEAASVPTSHLITIVDRWIDEEFVSPEDREWLNEHCGARVYRLNPFSLVDPAAAVIEHYRVNRPTGEIPPKTMPMVELESAAANLFLEFLQEHYRKHDDPRRPRIKRCSCCDRLFRTMQGYPEKAACSKPCTQKLWEKSRQAGRATRRARKKRGATSAED